MRRRIITISSFLVIFYLVSATAYLLHRSFSDTKASIGLLQSGENNLVSNPTLATTDFQLSEQKATDSLGAIRSTKWWDRLISLLPPLRWQVELAKASYSLSEAGQSSISLQKSLSSLHTTSDSGSDALMATGNEYLTWYEGSQSTVAALHGQLMTAAQNFAPIPSWIFLNQSDSFAHLQQQLQRLTGNVGEEQKIGDGIISLTNKPSLQTALLIALPASSKDSGSLLAIGMQNGRIISIDDTPLSSTLLTMYGQSEQKSAFWSSTARAIALASSKNGQPASAIAVVSPQLIRDLLAISGPVEVPGVANPNITATTWDGSQAAFTDVSATLISSLLQPDKKASAEEIFRLDSEEQSVQVWTSNLELSTVLNQLPDSQPPSGHKNWIRVIPHSTDPLLVTFSSQSQIFGQDIRQTVTITDSTAAPDIALPLSASVIGSAKNTIESGYQQVTLPKTDTETYSVRYTLPLTTQSPGQIVFLPPLTGTQKVSAFGRQQRITQDALLTQ